jgi:uncharacterized repeat protein (TIGR01451 family)
MILGWMNNKMKKWFSGRKTGKPIRSPFTGSGAGRTSFNSSRNWLCSCLPDITTAAVELFLLAFTFTLLSAAPAWANLAANTRITNAAQMSYIYGGNSCIATASVAVKVSLIAAAPTIVAQGPYTTQYTGPATTLTDTFVITAGSNGPDTYNLTAKVTGETNGTGAYAVVVAPTSIVLGASVTVDGSTATIINVPSDGIVNSSVNGIEVGDTVVINGEVRTVTAIDDEASGTSTITLGTALSSIPAAGVLVEEQKTIQTQVISGTITTVGTNLVVTDTITATSATSPNPATTSSAVTNTFTKGLASFAKYIRNVTTSAAGSGATYQYPPTTGPIYYTTGVTAKPGDFLEYILVSTNSGSVPVSSSVVTDILPTTYVSLKTGVYSGETKDITYVDDTGTASYLLLASGSDAATYVAPTLTVNVGTGATKSAGGTIPVGKSVLVLYQVNVNSPAQGDKIVNSAQLSSPDIIPIKSAVTVTANIGLVTITKYVRNVTTSTSTAGSGATTYQYPPTTGPIYYTAGVMAKPGDILEYILVSTNSGSVPVLDSVVTDILPTIYVSLKMGVYSGGTKDITYVDDTGAASYLLLASSSDAATYVAPTLTVNVGTGATKSAGGTIPVGKSVLVLYQVNVNSPAQGDKITNSARLSSSNIIPASWSVTVTGNAVIRTKSILELFTYAPALPGADLVNVSTTAYRTGSAVTDPFINMPAPVPVGSTSPIDLSKPVPLTAATQLHQGEPIFIRLTDFDQNLDPLVAETVLVTIMDSGTGDVEVIRITETGPNTGVFAGYLPTISGTSGKVTSYNGILSVNTGDKLTASYVDIMDPSDKSVKTEMVDPYGIVLDSSTGQPVNGAVITIQTATGGTVKVFGDDGISTFPSTIISGGSASDSGGKAYSFPKGSFRFPFVLPGSYKYQVTPPAGYGYPSIVATAIIQALPGAPFTIVAGSRGETFVLNPGPSMRIDIPLDTGASTLWLQKSAAKDSAGQGDFIPYQLIVTNGNASIVAAGVRVVDTLPVGFRYRGGSFRLNGVSAGDPTISADGRTLTFNVGTLAGGSAATINYVAEVTAGTRLGEAINSAIASSAAGIRSNNARVTVKIIDDFMRTKSILMGRVSTGACNDKTGEGPNGVEDVRVYLEDGSFVISDKRGLFHFEGIRDGLHVVQLDLDSLPDGYEAFACTENSRFAGRAFSQFVETQGGTLWRTDFHVRKKQSAVNPPVASEPLKGEIVLELANTTEEKKIAYRVAMRGKILPVRAARLNVILPEGVLYEPGSSMMDGVAMADPIATDKTKLVFKLNDLPAGWHHEITFRGMPSSDIKAGTLTTQAYLAADGDAKAEVLTPPAETILQLDKKMEISPMPDIILRPHFPIRGAELNAEDRIKLDGLARTLSDLRTDKIQVTGYTDNIPIAPQHRIYYADNQALSWARAKSVGRYLMDKLHIPPEKLFLDGKGSAAPIASNSTEAGRALNRRVEVRITSSRIIDRSRLKVIKELSGEKRTETTAPKNAPEGGNNKSSMAETQTAAAKQQAGNVVALPDSDKAVQKADKAPPRSDSTATAAVKADAPSAVVAPAGSSPVSPKVSAASAPEKSEITIKDPEGILYPADKDILVNNIESVRVCLNSKLTPRLLLDDKEVPEKRIGFTMKDENAGKTIYSYIGVDFGKAGNHVVQFQGIDPFGNARFNKTISVKRSGEIVSIRFKSAQGNVADGKTPVKLRLELYDAEGTLIPAATELEIREGTLNPLKQPDIFAAPPAPGSHPRVQMSREGDVLFQPVNNSGPYRVVLGCKNVTVEAETYVQPSMRDWILVGLAEGTAGYNTVSGNMENLQGAGVNENLYKDSRVAFFAKGQIKGKWLLTMAYDSAKSKGNDTNGLFQTINPDSYYTLYGDTSQQQYDAASAKNLYIKIEREQFYAMFGDYDTGMTVTELSRYSRRMTGIKTELQTRNFELNAFASETEQIYKRDEIPGDGTSGIYHLSRKNIVPNSDKITIEVRDRFRSEVLVSTRSLSRFMDYSIDYDAGTIIFKEPIFSRDEKFNPVMIVAEYEIISEGGKDYTYGGRAGVKLLDNKLKAGASYIHEGQGDANSNLYGVDASYKLSQNTKIRGEFARSEYSAGAESHSGNAYLVEASHSDKNIDAKAYIREQEDGFGLGQQPGSEAGTRKIGVEGAYRFSETFNGSANIYRQYNLTTDATRDMAEGKLNYSEKNYGASVGFLHANDILGDGSKHESNQLTLGGKVLTLYDRLTLGITHAQSIGSNDNSDFPTRTTLSAEFAATKKLTLLAAQEFTWGTSAETQNTRVGMRYSPWKGADLNSSVERQFNENDERVFANVGLKQTWQVNKDWKVDAGVDRSQTISKSEHYQFNTNVPPSSGVNPTTGTNDDFTAVTGGATYQTKKLTWDNRLEFRFSNSEDKWGLMSGVVKEVNSDWAWSGRLQFFQTSVISGIDTARLNLRQGLVYRPPETNWIALNRLDFIVDRQSGGTSVSDDSWRLVNNFIINNRPRKDLQLSLHYGAKYVREKIDGNDYSGYTDLVGAEVIYDINKYWDLGLHVNALHSWTSGQLDYSEGVSVGYNVAQNAWVSLGYNLTGFDDKDFSQSEFTAQGPYVRFRFKFDQQSVRDAAKWVNGN